MCVKHKIKTTNKHKNQQFKIGTMRTAQSALSIYIDYKDTDYLQEGCEKKSIADSEIRYYTSTRYIYLYLSDLVSTNHMNILKQGQRFCNHKVSNSVLPYAWDTVKSFARKPTSLVKHLAPTPNWVCIGTFSTWKRRAIYLFHNP